MNFPQMAESSLRPKKRNCCPQPPLDALVSFRYPGHHQSSPLCAVPGGTERHSCTALSFCQSREAMAALQLLLGKCLEKGRASKSPCCPVAGALDWCSVAPGSVPASAMISYATLASHLPALYPFPLLPIVCVDHDFPRTASVSHDASVQRPEQWGPVTGWCDWATHNNKRGC